MNLVSKVVVVLLLTSLVCVIPVTAQTDQGFEWGFEQDDAFHFMMHVNGTGFQLDEEIYLDLNDTLPSIPDSMDDWSQIPNVTIDAFYANGTRLGIEVLMFVAMYNAHLPIGNWDLLSTLAETTHDVENFTLDPDDSCFWGYSWEDDNWVLSGDGWTIWSNYTLYVHVDYLKTDGFLTHYSVDAYNTTTMADAGEITLERLDLEKYIETTNPSLNHPDNIMFIEGQEGNSITWQPYDENPGSYEILVDGELHRSGLWNLTSEAIVEIVDHLTVGNYNYTLIVYDVRGNSASDTVMVTVQPATSMPLVLISVLAGVGVFVVVVAVFRRR